MYPSTFAEWLALIAAVSPIVVWGGAAIQTARTKSIEFRQARWQRLRELAAALHNKEQRGVWEQHAAIAELADMSGIHRIAARDILSEARKTFLHPMLTIPLDEALAQINRGWVRRLFRIRAKKVHT